MARKPAKKSVTTAKPATLGLKPGLITMAAALGWGALNEPAAFTAATMTTWLLTMGAVAVAAHAALLLGGPLLKILAGQCQAALAQFRSDIRSAPKP